MDAWIVLDMSIQSYQGMSGTPRKICNISRLKIWEELYTHSRSKNHPFLEVKSRCQLQWTTSGFNAPPIQRGSFHTPFSTFSTFLKSIRAAQIAHERFVTEMERGYAPRRRSIPDVRLGQVRRVRERTHAADRAHFTWQTIRCTTHLVS